ncbi:tetrahydromethanopterin S-methyltransferase subunit H family protein [Candidatus Formimonas warabiya]|uniref:Tetrahydromethanopterin S-methyltransferase n=1 Tax=Formimonas warabiya TaxID=1761012 RepID=A0A3G1KSS3_FORW1|nr:tetrahydromethanopterin S-methyltransferase subunit H [Candidatus Formimonas warabiya]ATW25480.1 tetrahydromethanopterin S-methyltransferase [Candidatus Formimonas warabiya]
MFTLTKDQKICRIENILVGGQPGENPPLMIASMFHNGDRILESRKERKFDRNKARDYLLKQEELSDQTGIPALVAMVATSADEMKSYIDFYLSVSSRPFGIDMWVEKARLEAIHYVAELGLQDKVLYNSITPWDKDIPGQVAQLKELGIKNVVVQVFDEGNQTPAGRVYSLKKMMAAIGEDTFPTVLVDTSVMNLPAISFSALACKLIKQETGLPAGVAASNGTYMWKEAREMWGADGFSAMNFSAQAISTVLWSDFLFYGPIVAAPKAFPAMVSAALMLATLAYEETGKLPTHPQHPLFKFFGDFAAKLS